MDTTKKVLSAMKKAGKPVRNSDIVKITDLDSKEITKAIKTLKAEGKIISPKRCYYEPK